MEYIFIDTSGLYALRNESDKFHNKSIEIYQRIGNSGEANLIITNFILCEFINLINMRKNHKYAIKCLDFIQKSSFIHTDRINPSTEKNAINIFKQNSDKNYSYTDCTSFAYMKVNNIKKVFAFDQHFKQFGFELIK